MQLDSYLNNGIASIARKAGVFYLKSREGRRFLKAFVPATKRAAALRAEARAGGRQAPPFLIASIATRCNLHCAGCYARANGSTGSGAVHDELSAGEWQRVFRQAVDMGVSFVLLAGGEPMLRMDVLEAAAGVPELAFPVFTNGTLLSEEKAEFFHARRNLVPVLSLEGDEAATDARRGEGVARRLREGAERLRERGVLFGASLTVTRENMEELTRPAYTEALAAAGCALLIFVVFVPAEAGSEALALDDALNAELERRVAALKQRYRDMIILSFPGDEKAMGGCLAAGRGFFHINAAGGAEPCPFSPYSDVSLKTHTLSEALESPLFGALRTQGILDKPHTGGCVLFGQEDEVRRLAGGQAAPLHVAGE